MKMLLCTMITFLVYRIVKWAYRKWKLSFLNPLLISPIILIIFIGIIDVPANEFISNSKWVTHMLGPATVAFAIPIYKNFHLIKKYSSIILLSIITGTLTAVFSSFLLALIVHLKPDLILSVIPRSITVPIAIEVSKEIGGLPVLTTVFAIMTAIIGSIIGPLALKWLSIKTPIARGLALGVGAHGVGTAKAKEYGEQEFTFSTLGMILAALVTMIWGGSLIPLIEKISNLSS